MTASGRLVGRPVVPAGPLADLKALLYELYVAAGTPTLDAIAAWVGSDRTLAGSPGRDTVARVIGDATVPGSQADVVAVATVLADRALWDPADAAGRARDLWVATRLACPAGVLLDEVVDPFALEVHKPIEAGGARGEAEGLPPLPPYVHRAHDEHLRRVVRAAAEGSSGIAVLVGGSSTGKTRACWEALGLLRDSGGWRLWRPLSPGWSEDALGELPRVGSRTVVWLNEAQEYLSGPDGERAAAKLRGLLGDRARAPVLVLGTLWPEEHEALTCDHGSPVRLLLDGRTTGMPAAFAGDDLAAWREAARRDPRMAEAAARAEDGEVTQYLAGGPALLERYALASRAAWALITAAMDARRLGMGPTLPLAFLEAAAPAYLTDAEWDALGDDWAERALAYAAVRCKGARGPLTRIRPRPGGLSDRRAVGGPAVLTAGEGPLYRLADYLDQHGRASRATKFPPAGFWGAAAAHATPADQSALGDAAHNRGLYRDAAQLHKNAAGVGIIRSAIPRQAAGRPGRRLPSPCLGSRPRRPQRLGWRGPAAAQPSGVRRT